MLKLGFLQNAKFNSLIEGLQYDQKIAMYFNAWYGTLYLWRAGAKLRIMQTRICGPKVFYYIYFTHNKKTMFF
jgi:hypothetical protein